MDIYNKVRGAIERDDAVSPVIAVILMVAITVVLAATVYVWVSGFASEDTGPEQASATAEGAGVGESDVDWIRITLTKGNNAPYAESDVNYTLLAPDGSSHSADDNGGNDFLCKDAKKTGSNPEHCANDFFDGTPTSDANNWDVGQTLYMPCQDSGDHSVTISVRGTTVLDTSVSCDAAADDT